MLGHITLLFIIPGPVPAGLMQGMFCGEVGLLFKMSLRQKDSISISIYRHGELNTGFEIATMATGHQLFVDKTKKYDF